MSHLGTPTPGVSPACARRYSSSSSFIRALSRRYSAFSSGVILNCGGISFTMPLTKPMSSGTLAKVTGSCGGDATHDSSIVATFLTPPFTCHV